MSFSSAHLISKFLLLRYVEISHRVSASTILYFWLLNSFAQQENRVPGSTKCWTPPMRVPCCLLSHLEEIRILKFDGDGYDLGVIVYLLENAQVLKKLTIDCQNSTRFFRDKLAEFPRGSKTCQLSFLV